MSISYIVHVGYYDFAFNDAGQAMEFAKEALSTNIEENGLRVKIELKEVEPAPDPEPTIENVVDLDTVLEAMDVKVGDAE